MNVKFWKKQQQPEIKKRPPQVPKKQGCTVKYKKTSDGMKVSFSSECHPQERAEILKQLRQEEQRE